MKRVWVTSPAMVSHVWDGSKVLCGADHAEGDAVWGMSEKVPTGARACEKCTRAAGKASQGD